MKKNKSLLILSSFLSVVLFTGCTDPLSLALMAGMFDRKKSDVTKPPKLICSNGVAQVEGQSAGIVGGQILEKDTWLAKGIVLVVQVYTDPDTKKQAQSLCTGSLIDDNMVLTAAHCVDSVRNNYQDNLTVFLPISLNAILNLKQFPINIQKSVVFIFTPTGINLATLRRTQFSSVEIWP